MEKGGGFGLITAFPWPICNMTPWPIQILSCWDDTSVPWREHSGCVSLSEKPSCAIAIRASPHISRMFSPYFLENLTTKHTQRDSKSKMASLKFHCLSVNDLPSQPLRAALAWQMQVLDEIFDVCVFNLSAGLHLLSKCSIVGKLWGPGNTQLGVQHRKHPFRCWTTHFWCKPFPW